MKRILRVVLLAVVAGVSLTVIHSAMAAPPRLFLPANIVAEADRPTGAVVTYTVTGTDERGRALRVVCSPQSGSVFPLGQRTVRCDGWKLRDDDDDDPVVSGSFTVTVRDTTAPALALPADVAVEATGADGARVTYAAPTATDLVDGNRPVSCSRVSGSLFPLGDTQVSCTASDTRGNTRSGSFKITVRDTAPPALELPVNLGAEAVGPAGAPVAYSARATDVVDGAVAVSCERPSGSTFPLGQTTVPCTAADSRGNRANGSFSVTIRDTTAPTLGLPGGVDTEATSGAGATISFETGATDTVDGAVAVTCNPASGSVFPVGVTEVSCTASDSRGNRASGSFGITIRDPAPPVLHLPGNVLAEAAGADGATVEYAASATDAVDGAVAIACGPASGSRFPLGDTQVTCRASDTRGNESVGSFRITVRDTTAPVVSAPEGPVAEAQGADGTAVAYSGASGVDAVDGPVAVTCSPASGSLFPLGESQVSCSARDSRGNTGTASFTVTVRDTSPPALLLPADRLAEASGADGVAVTYPMPTATDAVDGPVGTSCSPASGSVFPLGETRVDCSTRDIRGNAVWGSFVVRVGDASPPRLELPEDLVTEATGPAGARVEYLARAADTVEGSVPVSCDAPSGSVFALGETSVSCRASDSLGHEASATFRIRVRDTTAPVLNVPDDPVAEASGPDGAEVEYEAPTGTDVVDGAVTVGCRPASGSAFPLGASEVSCTAADSRGNDAAASFTVTVRDTSPPALLLPADRAAEAAGPAGAEVAYPTPTANDAVDGPVGAGCSPASGSVFPLGETRVDCSARDSRGNAVWGSFVVRVRDGLPPALDLPDDLVAEASGPGGASVEYTARASDTVEGGVPVSCDAPSGSVFAFGKTEVLCRASDSAGNAVTASFSVTVRDTTAPALELSDDRAAEASGPGGATVEYDASATDAVDGAVAVTCSRGSGSVFPLGETEVTCTASDSRHNGASASFRITVRDTRAPALDLPGDAVAEASGAAGAEVDYDAPHARDAVDGEVAVTCERAAGVNFPLGETVVACAAADSRGNRASGSFTVTVRDTTAPALGLPDDLVTEATGAAGTAVEYEAAATDLVDGAVAIACTSPSGAVFALGQTEVSCAARDERGNERSGSFKVTVRDTIAPTLVVPDGRAAEAAGPDGAAVEYAASASDLVDGSVAVSCDAVSGAVYPLGETRVACTATDSRGNRSSRSFTVTVRDTTAPVLDGPAEVIVEATAPDGAAVEYEISAADAVDGAVAVTCNPASGSVLPLGETEILCRATDSRGNESSDEFLAQVHDRRPPVLKLPDDIVAEATGPDGARVEYVATATDAVDGAVAVTCSPASGSIFRLGTTDVSCSAKDKSNNRASGSFSVRVRDTTAPTLTLPDDLVAEATGPGGARVDYEVRATDLVDGAVPVSCNRASGATYPLGEREVTCTASDDRDNRREGSFKVTIRDTTPPAIEPRDDVLSEATGSDGARIAYEAPAATDLVDGSVAVACEPASGSLFPVGDTEIACRARDGRGNESSRRFQAKVRDRKPPVLDLPENIVAEATGSGGAAIEYAASATDVVDGAVTVSCSRASGVAFPLGETEVACTAEDGSGNESRGAFSVTVRDTTAPALVVPDDLVAEATGPDGAKVEYEANATDTVDGTVAVACDTAAGASYPIGETRVTCTARDSRRNEASGAFAITVRDTTPPALPAKDVLAEATGPEGAKVDYEAKATDKVDGAVAASCDPAAGALYPFGKTRVSCTAKDSRGNETSVSFDVEVRDTTAPSLKVPEPLQLTTDAEEVSDTAAEIDAFLKAVEVLDAVDPAPTLAHDAPASFPQGKTIVAFSAVDAAGNRRVRTSSVTVARPRAAEPPASESPSGNGPAAQPSAAGPDPAPTAGTKTPPAVGSGPSRARALLAPSDGARVRRPPLLTWRRTARASYYNVQLYRNGRKVLSAWPTRARLRLKGSWVYKGRQIRLKPGVYRWFVWPGYGKPARARYGALIGASTFTVVGKRG